MKTEINHRLKPVFCLVCAEKLFSTFNHFLMFTFHPNSDEKFHESPKSFAEAFLPSPSSRIWKRESPHTDFEVTFAPHFISAYYL